MKRDLKVKALFFSLISASIFGAEDPNEQLWDAVSKGFKNKVSNLIKRDNADVDTISKKNKGTPLIFTAQLDETVPYQTATMWEKRKVADEKMALVTKKLLSLKANPTTQDMWGMTALMWAARNDAQKVLKTLLQNKSAKETINMQDKYGNTALIHAVRDSKNAKRESFIEVVKTLLTNRANPNISNNQRKSALEYAAITKRYLIIGLLFSFGAEVTENVVSQSKSDETVLTILSDPVLVREEGGSIGKHPYDNRPEY